MVCLLQVDFSAFFKILSHTYMCTSLVMWENCYQDTGLSNKTCIPRSIKPTSNGIPKFVPLLRLIAIGLCPWVPSSQMVHEKKKKKILVSWTNGRYSCYRKSWWHLAIEEWHLHFPNENHGSIKILKLTSYLQIWEVILKCKNCLTGYWQSFLFRQKLFKRKMQIDARLLCL